MVATGAGGDWKDLLKASEEGNVALVKYHLHLGVDPNYQHPEYFTCPIFEAIRNGHFDIVCMLVEKGNAKPDICEDLTGQTPMDAALESKQFKIAEYLNQLLPSDKQVKFHHVLVTGGNRGIGKEICRQLLHKGHHVVFTCRSEAQGVATAEELRKDSSNEHIDFIIGDLGSVRTTLILAKAIGERFPTMNVLVHNAGLWPTAKHLNEEGIEKSFCVNYLARFILTRELGPLLCRSGPDSRIVFLSGQVYAHGNADIAKTPFGKDFQPMKTYMNTKQCAVILFLNTARNLANTCVKVNAVHPGNIRTGLGESRDYTCCLNIMLRCVKRFWKETSVGATDVVWLAESEEGANFHGHYYNGRHQDTIADNVADESLQRDWETWTVDFLSSVEKCS